MNRTAMLGVALVASLGIGAGIVGEPRRKPMQGRFIEPPPNRQPPLRADTWTARRKAAAAAKKDAIRIARHNASWER